MVSRDAIAERVGRPLAGGSGLVSGEPGCVSAGSACPDGERLLGRELPRLTQPGSPFTALGVVASGPAPRSATASRLTGFGTASPPRASNVQYPRPARPRESLRMSEPQAPPVDRRNFLRSGAAVGTALSLSAVSYAKVAGANSRLGVAFLGCGGRAQAHINTILKLKAVTGRRSPRSASATSGTGRRTATITSSRPASSPAATTPRASTRRPRSAGLASAIQRASPRTTAGCSTSKTWTSCASPRPTTGTPGMTLDALAAGKDVFVEKPMTRTAAEAQARRRCGPQVEPRGRRRRAGHGRPGLDEGARTGPLQPHRPGGPGADRASTGTTSAGCGGTTG